MTRHSTSQTLTRAALGVAELKPEVNLLDSEPLRGRLQIMVSFDLEPIHQARMQRSEQLNALCGYLRSRLLRDGLWPACDDVVVTLGDEEGVRIRSVGGLEVGAKFPGYSSRWSALKFERSVCRAAKRFFTFIAPAAQASRYIVDFESSKRTFRWSYSAGLLPGAFAILDCELTRNRFCARLTVRVKDGRSSRFRVHESRAAFISWAALLGRLKVSRGQVVIEAAPRSAVELKGRSSSLRIVFTGSRPMKTRFVARVSGSNVSVVRQFASRGSSRTKPS